MISRMDLADSGSPEKLVGTILKVQPNFLVPVPVEQICSQLDISRIEDLDVKGFVGGLITDVDRRDGIIMVQEGLDRPRRRFTIAHELGHFLLLSHMPSQEGRFLCSKEDMLRLPQVEQDRRVRMEAEANRFASLLLIPPPLLLPMSKGRPDFGMVLSLAEHFDVSKEAMTRAYVSSHPDPIAAIIVQNGVVQRFYKSHKFPAFLDTRHGSKVEQTSQYHDQSNIIGKPTRWIECDPETWLGLSKNNKRVAVYEQVYLQQNGYATILLKADFPDEEEDREY